MDILVACALWGDWPAKGYAGKHTGKGWSWEYVRRLKNSVARNLSYPHEFVCFTDKPEEAPSDINALPLKPMGWARGFPKSYVYTATFSGASIEEGRRVIMFDLDNIIVGSLDDMAAYEGEFCVRGTFPGTRSIDRVDGDMISFIAGCDTSRTIFEQAKIEAHTNFRATKGDERFLIKNAVPNVDIWQEQIPGQIVSYREQARNGPPPDARIVSMHGKPAPHEVQNSWIKEYWK